MHLLDDAVCEIFLHLDDPHIRFIAGRCMSDKYCKTAEVSNALAFCGHTGDIERNDLILAEQRCFLAAAAHLSCAPQPGQNESCAEFSLPQVGQVTVPPRCELCSIASCC